MSAPMCLCGCSRASHRLDGATRTTCTYCGECEMFAAIPDRPPDRDPITQKNQKKQSQAAAEAARNNRQPRHNYPTIGGKRARFRD